MREGKGSKVASLIIPFPCISLCFPFLSFFVLPYLSQYLYSVSFIIHNFLPFPSFPLLPIECSLDFTLLSQPTFIIILLYLLSLPSSLVLFASLIFVKVLDTQGPEALAKWVLAQTKVLLTDTTMRDGKCRVGVREERKGEW